MSIVNINIDNDDIKSYKVICALYNIDTIFKQINERRDDWKEHRGEGLDKVCDHFYLEDSHYLIRLEDPMIADNSDGVIRDVNMTVFLEVKSVGITFTFNGTKEKLVSYLGRDIVNRYLELFYVEYKRVHREINRFNEDFDPANDRWLNMLLDIFATIW